MNKLVIAALGLSLALGSSLALAQDPPKTDDAKKKKKKKKTTEGTTDPAKK